MATACHNSMCVCVKLKLQFATVGNGRVFKRHASSYSIVFGSLQSLPCIFCRNQTKTTPLHLTVSRSEQKTFQCWNKPSLFKLVWSSFFFCRLNSLFQVKVFEAIRHNLHPNESSRVENSKACQHTKYGNWIQSQAGINTNFAGQKRAIFVKLKAPFIWSWVPETTLPLSYPGRGNI